MKQLLATVSLLFLASCGWGGNVTAVTPVMADTRGTYRLLFLSESVTAAGGASSVVSANGGTLRLFDTSYQRTLADAGTQSSSGTYALGTSVNTILNSRVGSFTLTSSDPPFILTGSYRVAADFTLTLDFNQFALPDQSLVTRSESWQKVSDSPRHGA